MKSHTFWSDAWPYALAGFGAMAACAGVYFYKFAPGYWFTLSDSSAQWANFGTFVGGIAGPLFSMLAFVAAAMAMVYQARQLQVLKDQAHHQEMQRTLATLSETIDRVLAEPTPNSWLEELREAPQPNTLDNVILTLSTLKTFGPEGFPTWTAWMEGMTREDILAEEMKALWPQTSRLIRELDSMAWCLNRLSISGGNPDVESYYCRRYRQVALGLTQLKAAGDQLDRFTREDHANDDHQ
jgi:hypothetical protein